MTNSEAPWTQEQVEGIIAYQTHPHSHEYTCPQGHGPLAVTSKALTCTCGHTQTWVDILVADGHWRTEPEQTPGHAVFDGPNALEDAVAWVTRLAGYEYSPPDEPTTKVDDR